MGNVSLEVKSIFKPDIFQTSHKPNTYQPGNKRNVSCFYCGKPEHVSRECRTRLASEKNMTTVKSHEVSVVQKVGSSQTEKKPIVCFSWRKSPQCPKRQQPIVKIIQIPIKSLKKLKRNEVMASVSGVHVPTTIDSGADRALIPEDLVQPDPFTVTVEAFNWVAQGTLQGKIAKVVFRIAGVDYPREALAVPGEQIFWTAALSLDPNNMEQVDYLFGQVRKNTHLSEEDSHYKPPRMMDGKVQGAVMVSEET